MGGSEGAFVTVYVIFLSDYDDEHIAGVFTDEEEANRIYAKLESSMRFGGVYEMEVDREYNRIEWRGKYCG